MGFWRKKSASGPYNLQEQDYVVLDTETTGFHTSNDRILSIGVVRVQASNIVLNSAREWFIRFEEELGHSPTIHGITKDKLEAGLTEPEAVDAFLDYIGNSVLVAHYATFDRAMLEALARRTGRNLQKNLWLDTMDIEVALEPAKHGSAEALKLDALLQQYDIEAVARHTALGDAFSTARLLQNQLARLRNSGIQSSDAIRPPRVGLL